jgi:hypothetical protein
MPGVHQRMQQTILPANKFASGLAPDPRRYAAWPTPMNDVPIKAHIEALDNGVSCIHKPRN